MIRGTLPVLVGAFLGTSLLPSCKGKPHDPANLVAIDHMLGQVDSLERTMNAVDVHAYDHMDSVFLGQKDRLDSLMNDTLDRDRALILGNYYRAMSGSVDRVRKLNGEVRAELVLSREQLTTLRHDVANGLLEEEAEHGHVDQEELHLAQLMQQVEILRTSAGHADLNWNEHHARVDTILAATVLAP